MGYDLTDVVGLAPPAPVPPTHVREVHTSDDDHDTDTGMNAPHLQLDDELLQSDPLGEVLAGFDLVGEDFTFDGEDDLFSGLGL